MTEFKYFKKTAQNRSENDQQERITQIPADSIRPNRSQPRACFDNNSMIRLADSIRRYGILQPLSVRRADDGDSYDYELIAGERRLRAAKMLGLFTVPCIILETDERTSAELAIIENLLREDLNIFEQATSFRRLIEDYGMTQEELARKMSMSQSTVANKLRLLKLTYQEQKLILDLSLSERHARALLKLDAAEERIAVITTAAEDRLTVQATEELIDKIIAAKESAMRAQETCDNDFDPIEKAFKEEKEIAALVKSFKKKIDNVCKSGKSATIDVSNQKDKVLVTILIKK
jgi:ParB family chromosome partitioning protein